MYMMWWMSGSICHFLLVADGGCVWWGGAILFWLQLEEEKDVYDEVEQSCYFGCSWRRRRMCMMRWSNLVILVAAGGGGGCVWWGGVILLCWLQLEEEKSVYDVVDEGEYSDLVRQRQEDDWIVDDGEILVVFISSLSKKSHWLNF